MAIMQVSRKVDYALRAVIHLADEEAAERICSVSETTVIPSEARLCACSARGAKIDYEDTDCFHHQQRSRTSWSRRQPQSTG